MADTAGMTRSPEQRLAADRRWFQALRAAAAVRSYRIAVAISSDEHQAELAVLGGFREAWRRRARRPVGRAAGDWVVRLVEQRARRAGSRHRDRGDLPERWEVSIPSGLLHALDAIPDAPQRAHGGLVRLSAALAAAIVLIAVALVAVSLVAVVSAPHPR